jgi:hypothetical protein
MNRRIALLIGNQMFLKESGLPNLNGPLNDVNAIERVLKDPELGNFEVQKIVDQPHYDVMRTIVETLQLAAQDDFVLIFYSGHGKMSGSGKLYLATANTTQTALQATAVSAWSLHEAVSDAVCREVVLLLDCCYSGAVAGLRGEVVNSQLQAVQNAAGFFILTASTSIQSASESETDHDGEIMGRFTAAIVDGIQSGDADFRGTGEIRLTDLKTHVERTLRGQTPQFFAHAGTGDPLLSYSPRPLLDERAIADLEDDAWHRRVGAIKYLTDILRKGKPRESRAARATLTSRHALEQNIDVRQVIEDALRPQAAPILVGSFRAEDSQFSASTSRPGDAHSSTGPREKVLRGVNAVADAARATLGPKGRTVVVGGSRGTPSFTKNGLLIASALSHSGDS